MSDELSMYMAVSGYSATAVLHTHTKHNSVLDKNADIIGNKVQCSNKKSQIPQKAYRGQDKINGQQIWHGLK